jgi:DNA helicase-2/ATP-dependent DNA helicase PcrA
MDITKILEPLNDKQREAVAAPCESVLVLAGAGSGKTRVLVHRVAWQIEVNGLSPHNILAVTFTNKAAKEMRGRIEALLGIPTQSMWVGTFHGIAHRLLRRHASQAKLPDTFQVMDSADQLRLIKRVLDGLELDESQWPPRQMQWHINAQKDEGIRARNSSSTGDKYQQVLLNVYQAYEQACEQAGLVDFAELLLRAHELLRDNAEVLEAYQHRFRQIHVDEFQDTNAIQYAWLRLLAGNNDNLFVVGDDDQSIYGWRGAKIGNIYDFQTAYRNHHLIKLEQNYRSTAHILNAANAVIGYNQDRLGKTLWTDEADGDLLSLYAAFNEQDEAHFVIERIRAWLAENGSRQDVAILYRSNAQSRQFEERLMTVGIPYRVYGGLRFFDRAEIKNALAYLRLMANHNDDASFERIINTPTRGIGLKTVEDIRQIARSQDQSLWQASTAMIQQGRMSARANNALAGFLQLIGNLAEQTETLELYEKVGHVVENCGLIEFYEKEKADNGEEKIDNLKELVNAAKSFEFVQEDEENWDELSLFLSHAALESGDNQGDNGDSIQLMTLHSAKGLEFKLVFLVGLEDGLFPSQQSLEDPVRLEEERRLCYVGITRARQHLYLSYAESRRLYGRETYPRPSRFLREIPETCLREVRLSGAVAKQATVLRHNQPMAASRYRPGQNVSHPKFGEGTILQVEGEGAQERVQIRFAPSKTGDTASTKWLMLAYAKLDGY